jgi:hypothetical protein
MKAIGRVNTSSNPRTWLALVAAGLLLILLASLALLTGSAYARAGPGCVNPDGCLYSRLTPPDRAGKIVVQNAQVAMDGSSEGTLSTPMPVSYQTENAVQITDQGNQPFISDLLLLVFGVIGTTMAIGPLAVAALLDMRAARRQ